MRAVRDDLTADLFAVPAPVIDAGALAIGPKVRALISDLIRESGLSRYQIAARMSELLETDISKHQIDSWTAESREGWRFPLEYLPALEVALETHAVTAMIADIRGARLLVGRAAVDAEIGKLERLRDDAAVRIKALKAVMRGEK